VKDKKLLKDFERESRDNPFLSSFSNFAKAVSYQKYDQEYVEYWFDKLVSKKDYEGYVKEEILMHMIECNNRTPKK